MIKSENLLKIASSDPAVKKAILTLANFVKKAQDEQTEFNEDVQVMPNASEGAQPAQEGQPQPPLPGQSPNQPPMQEEMMQEGPADPISMGVSAAQEFLAPVFEAAAQGDPSAQQMIVAAAGEIAKSVAEAGMGGKEEPQAPPMQPQTPEEEVANQIVAEPKKKEEQVPPKKADENPVKKPEGQEKQSSMKVSMATVEKLVKMAKMGII